MIIRQFVHHQCSTS